jgi:hypothetical protein
MGRGAGAETKATPNCGAIAAQSRRGSLQVERRPVGDFSTALGKEIATRPAPSRRRLFPERRHFVLEEELVADGLSDGFSVVVFHRGVKDDSSR